MKSLKVLIPLIFLIHSLSYAALGPFTLLFNGSMTGTTAIHSNPIDTLDYTLASFEANWTGTPNGAIIIEGSQDNSNPWTNIGAYGWTDPAGSAGGALINIFGIGYRYIRLTYTNASSTGTLTVVGMAK